MWNVDVKKSMSEFKFACPVCGQHMMCDASQGGQVMTCPTCFQKITAPHAPAADGRFILTGTKVTEKKISTHEFADAPAAEKKFPGAGLIGLMVVVLVVGAAGFVFREKILSHIAPALVYVGVATNAVSRPAPAAPPASDLNWTLALDAAVTPNAAVVGRIHGQDFIVEQATYQNGLLILRSGAQEVMRFGVVINFGGAAPEALTGITINVRSAVKKAATVNLLWPDVSGTQKQSFNNGYVMRLEFGALASDHLPGKIYLCLPDAEKSYLMGNFNAEVLKPKLAAPPP